MTHPTTERKPETMGRRLASRRALLGLSQTEAAEKAGFSQAYLSQLEADKAVSPPLNTITKLAELYGVSIDYLVNGVAA
jgi:transcriptional regulator with XRE-family HTH domain